MCVYKEKSLFLNHLPLFNLYCHQFSINKLSNIQKSYKDNSSHKAKLRHTKNSDNVILKIASLNKAL